MATTPRKRTKAKPRPKTAAERMAARRARLRAQGLKPVTFWLPDMNDPKVRADLRRQGRLMAKHNEGGAVDEWLMSLYDPDA